MANYGPNKQLREFHRLFTMKRDHKVVAYRTSGGNLGGGYKCSVCEEWVDRSGTGFRHQPKYIGN